MNAVISACGLYRYRLDLTLDAQGRMCGNSVCPPLAEASSGRTSWSTSERRPPDMAEPCAFSESNALLIGSPEDRAAGTVVDLPVHRYRDLDGGWHVISCWELTEAERAEILRTGRVWLHSWGITHPPISVGGQTPFAPTAEQGAA